MPAEHRDVIIIGAGISGLGAAVHLQKECPDKDYVILEGRDAIGGTWDLFRYPGIRSDSDLFTFGYEFKPWYAQPIATAPQILEYLHEVVDEYDIEKDICFDHWVDSAEWSTEDATWRVTATTNGQQREFVGRFLFMCQGYYDPKGGYRPSFPNEDAFEGTIIHPQEWPEDLDYTDKRMIVIGSGATAATIVPAVAERVAHVTQLQRSPTYYVSVDNTAVDPMIQELRQLDVPADTIYDIQRRKAIEFGRQITDRSLNQPDQMRQELIGLATMALGEDVDIEKHFTPRYDPWKERLCLLPDGDFFEAVKSGKASVETGEIERFVPGGIELKNGSVLAADIIVTATGIELCGLGNIRFAVDGVEMPVNDRWTYRGIMMSDLPNLAWIFGYIRSSWTLRSDLIAKYVCRLLKHMDELGVRQVTPRLRETDVGMNGKAFIDPADFAPGYIRRGASRLPKQSDHEPWTNCQDYYDEAKKLPELPLDDDVLVYDNPATQAA